MCSSEVVVRVWWALPSLPASVRIVAMAFFEGQYGQLRGEFVRSPVTRLPFR